MVRYFFEALGRNRAACGDELEEGTDLLGFLGAAEGDQQDGIGVGHRAESS